MKRSVRALCVVAHPDDETIWMGGTILKNSKWNWTILSLCRRDDDDRMPKFKKVCDVYRAMGIISDLDDEILKPLEIEEVVKKIKENLPSREFDYIFTHGENGEYGHIRHKEIHRAVKLMTGRGELKCKKELYFSYKPGKGRDPHNAEMRIPVVDNKSDFIIELGRNVHGRKIEIVNKLYGFNEGIFEVLACGSKEGFREAR